MNVRVLEAISWLIDSASEYISGNCAFVTAFVHGVCSRMGIPVRSVHGRIVDDLGNDIGHIWSIVDGELFDATAYAGGWAGTDYREEGELPGDELPVEVFEYLDDFFRVNESTRSACSSMEVVELHLNRAESIVEALLDEGRWIRYDSLPDRAKAALWQYMVTDGGVEEDEYDAHVRRFRYRLHTYTADAVSRGLDAIGWHCGAAGGAKCSDDERRIGKITKLWAKGKERWPYIVGGFTPTFREWASDEMNHGDGYHRIVAAIRRGDPIEFLYISGDGG